MSIAVNRRHFLFSGYRLKATLYNARLTTLYGVALKISFYPTKNKTAFIFLNIAVYILKFCFRCGKIISVCA